MSSLRRVCVFCGASTGHDPRWADGARALGRSLAGAGIELVYGGGAVGLMGVVADTVMAAGGRVTGVIPDGLFSREVGHEAITELIRTDSMHARKAMMYELADAFVVLPGGLGTLEELFETLTWAQIGLHSKPIGLLDVDGYYDPLLAFLRHATDAGFVKERHLAMLLSDASPDALLARLAAASAPAPDHRIDPRRI